PAWWAPPARTDDDLERDPHVRAPAAPCPGVNVVGYFASELGVGEAARQLVRGLDAVGVPVLPLRGPTTPLSRQGHPYAVLDHEAARYPLNLVCMNADVLPEFARLAGDSSF